MYDNASNLASWCDQIHRFRREEQFRITQVRRFRREERFRIAQEQFRIVQGEIVSESGVSVSIALTEGGGV